MLTRAISYTAGMSDQLEVWLRGPVEGIDSMLMPVAHALIQAREDIQRLVGGVDAARLWSRTNGAASLGFHIRHLGRALDRLFTYARGEGLSDQQKAAAREEATDTGASLPSLVEEMSAYVDRAMEQLRRTSREELLTERRIGRAGLPTTTLGALFHAAEHCTRHAGQAITTAKLATRTMSASTPS